jgi:murein L,D-transpeptidase YcbB/YkuD
MLIKNAVAGGSAPADGFGASKLAEKTHPVKSCSRRAAQRRESAYFEPVHIRGGEQRMGAARARLKVAAGCAAGVLAAWLAVGGLAEAQPGAASGATPPPVLKGPLAPLIIPPSPVPQVNLQPDQVALLEKTLNAADTQGFDQGAFVSPTLHARLGSTDPETRRAAQAELTGQTLRYATAVHAGRLPADSYLYEWGLKPAPYDPTHDFIQAASAGKLADWLASLPPPYVGYDSLRQGLKTYRDIADRGGWTAIPEGPELALGARGARVAALRARLAVEDAGVDAGGGAVFDQPLADALARAQKRFGLEPTGALNRQTLTALNVPVARRLDQILANMERWRWLPQELPADRIQVNIAAAILTLFQNDAPVLSMRAVTGRPGDETPMLQSQIQSIVFNPPWNVPSEIAAKELWPKEKANPGYFRRNDFIVIKTPDGGARLQQRAGDKAALGHVKFDFANRYGVYLHDTPSHSTFSKYARLVSHGCVRLEKPVLLADTLMQGSDRWTPDSIQQTIDGGDTVRAMLPKPMAVFLLYWTAYVGTDGKVNFRDDPYGWDETLMQRIDATVHGDA